MDVVQIHELAQLMNDMGLTKVIIEEDNNKIELERGFDQSAQITAPAPDAIAWKASNSAVADTPEDSDVTVVVSPMVGVFYAAPSPNERVYASVGDKVKKGDVLCLIEAMKLMNEITAERDGTIIEVCVGNGQVVEYEQPLFRMR